MARSWRGFHEALNMDNTNPGTDSSRRIDLTRQTDLQYWCRIFDVSMDELRDAVHHAGHQVEEVQRYLKQKRGRGGPA
jgi:hypothetical protein